MLPFFQYILIWGNSLFWQTDLFSLSDKNASKRKWSHCIWFLTQYLGLHTAVKFGFTKHLKKPFWFWTPIQRNPVWKFLLCLIPYWQYRHALVLIFMFILNREGLVLRVLPLLLLKKKKKAVLNNNTYLLESVSLYL